MASEASVVFFGRTKSDQTTNSLTDMIDDSMDLNLDITNSS